MRGWLLLLGVSASCVGGRDVDGDEGSPAYQARELVIAESNAATTAVIRAAAAPPAATFESGCSRSGIAVVTGQVAHGAPNAAFDVYVDLATCADRNPGTSDPAWDAITDGRVHWRSAPTAGGFAQTISGDVRYAGHAGATVCHLELQLTVDPAGATRYAGTACGLDVAMLFDGSGE